MKFFHSFRLDSLNQCLWRDQQRVPITPKAFDVLRYLVDRPGRLVTQEEILEALWPDTYVNQEVVKKYILGIRRVLGDRPDQPQFIRTFPKRGYQFVAPTSDGQRSTSSGAEAATPFIERRAAGPQIEACLTQAVSGTRQVVF